MELKCVCNFKLKAFHKDVWKYIRYSNKKEISKFFLCLSVCLFLIRLIFGMARTTLMRLSVSVFIEVQQWSRKASQGSASIVSRISDVTVCMFMYIFIIGTVLCFIGLGKHPWSLVLCILLQRYYLACISLHHLVCIYFHCVHKFSR